MSDVLLKDGPGQIVAVASQATQFGGLEQALTAAVAQVPSLVVLVVLVILFLKHLSEARASGVQRDEANRVFQTNQTQAFESLVEDCKVVIRDNSAAMREMAQSAARMK